MSINHVAVDRQHELAEFLRSRRARISPEEVGLPRGPRRRTPGLRREEVALLAGVSPEWYTWLEQERDIHVSVQVLESLARVLRLDATERAHLFLLAHKQPPPVETFSPPSISPTVHRFLNQLEAIPAGAVDARLNVVAGNKAQSVVFGDCTELPERERNLIWRLFTFPTVRERNAEWAQLAGVYLAQFRAGYGRYSDDPWWAEQIAELNRISPEFRELWPRYDVHTMSEGRKTMHHPRVGELHFDFLWLQTSDSDELRLLIHTPRPNTGTAEKIARLLAWEADGNTQNMSGDASLQVFEG